MIINEDLRNLPPSPLKWTNHYITNIFQPVPNTLQRKIKVKPLIICPERSTKLQLRK